MAPYPELCPVICSKRFVQQLSISETASAHYHVSISVCIFKDSCTRGAEGLHFGAFIIDYFESYVYKCSRVEC